MKRRFCFMNMARICDSRCRAFKTNILALSKQDVRRYQAGTAMEIGNCKIIDGAEALASLTEVVNGET